MSAVLASLDGFVAGRMRRSLTKHTTYGDWVSEIPDPMFRQLIREGVFRSVVYCFAGVAVVWFMNYEMPAKFDGPTNHVQLDIWLIALALIIAVSWRKLLGQCVEREFHYRRLHGKWRWER